MNEPRKLWGGLGNQMFQHAYIYSQFRDGLIPDIYVQGEEYFAKYKDEIKKWFGDKIVKSNFVSLHIRRGDYVNNPFYVDLTQTDYYDKAIEMFPDDKFLVFCADRQGGSDDPHDQDWVMNWLEGKYGDRFKLYKGWTEIHDMNAMAGCKAHIGANSSFSWWACYLGGGKTVMPSQWFTDGVKRITLLDEWIKI